MQPTGRILVVAIPIVVAGLLSAFFFLGSNPFALDSTGEVNVALKKPVVADSVYDERYPSSNAVDGDHVHILNRWLSSRTNSLDWSNTPHWLEINLGQPYALTRMNFWAGAQDEYKWPPADFRFQGRADGAWVDIFTETGNDKPVYSRRFAPFTTDTVRFIATRGTDPGALRLYEIEVYAVLE